MPFPTDQYFLGCPIWACPTWPGVLFTSKAPRTQWLSQYSDVFNTVEGNSTFYGLPAMTTIDKWIDSTPDNFRFALKFPKAISHEGLLGASTEELESFLKILERLQQANRLGPSFLQLPPTFTADEFLLLKNFIKQLPREMPFSVEVRHKDYFDQGRHENNLKELLLAYEIDYVIFDSRAMYSREPGDEREKEMFNQKPKSPIRYHITGKHPFVRFVGRNKIDEAQDWIDQWAPIVMGWILRGLQPFFFCHTADDTFAPEFARRFHNTLRQQLSTLPEFPETPFEKEQKDKNRQGSLF